MNKSLITFLLINFGALAIGGFWTSGGVASDWYQLLEKAPWTPPGWVFGAAWTVIMLLFTAFMAYAWRDTEHKVKLILLFSVQWILNVAWNPVFFKTQAVLGGFIIISVLTFLMGYFLVNYWKELKLKTLFVLPYFIWLLIATSLNGYILLFN
jgi:tryptophan-rich sensory protein